MSNKGEAHYNAGKIEVIDMMKDAFGEEAVKDFALVNALKYLARCNYKNQKNSDIFKAMNYLHYYLYDEWYPKVEVDSK